MKCPRCQAENRPQAKFCEECATPLARTCANCGTQLSATAKFCPECAHAVAGPTTVQPRFGSPEAYTPKHLAEKILTSKSALEGERKQVTVLFCDLANSTALAERLGPEAMHTLLSGFFELALAEVHRYEGTINQFLGDGFMALFGAPVSHEDHARRAALAALGIQRALKEGRADFGHEQGIELSARMGLNTGLVVVGSIGDNLRMDYTAVGDTTHLAARLQQLAEPRTILLSEVTRRLVRGYVRLEALEPVQVKGKAEPTTPYKVLGVGARRSPLEAGEERALSRFVGRERELAALDELLAQVEGGQGQVVGIVGEPGVGKSRLVHEFCQSLTGRRVTYLEGRCLSYGSTIPYLPVMDLLRNNCGITDADSPEATAEKVRLGLQEVGMDPEDGAPYLLHLLGVKEGTEKLDVLSPEAIKTRTFETLRQISLKGSRRRSLIFTVEDLHWMDTTSEEYFSSLVDSLAGAPILLLSTYRPGYRPPWLEKSYATQLALRPLSPQDSLSVVHSVLERERVLEPLAEVILSKAEGNPFFLEELTRAVMEHGDLSPTVAVPDTIQGVLMARIDRLADQPKQLLLTASVLGRAFPSRLLKAIWEEPGALEPLLRELKQLEFLYEQSGGEEPVYVFKHALTQEVAYESLLTPRRQALHAAAGRALEALYAERLDVAYDRLAYHYSRTEEAAKAVEYLTRFAEKAAAMYAHAEAVSALNEALAQAERLSAEEQHRHVLDLVLRQGESFHYLGRRQALVDLFRQHQDRLERLGDPSLAGRYYFRLGLTYTFLGNREQAAQNLKQALEEATRCGDEVTLAKAHRALAMEGWCTGQLEEGVAHGRQAVSLLERTEERIWLGEANWALSWDYYWMGEFELTLQTAARVGAIGETIGSRRLQSEGATMTGLTYATRGEWAAGIEGCQRALDLSPDSYETALILGWLGKAYLEKRDLAQAIGVLEQAVHQANQVRSRQVQAWFATLLAEAYLLNGQIERARNLSTKALEIATGVKFLIGAGLAQRTLGRIAQTEGELAEAQTHLNEALQTFASIRARFEVGRTYLDLAALAHAQGSREAVAAHLGEAHSLFRALRVPKYVERTEQLAKEFGVPLEQAEAELKGLGSKSTKKARKRT